MPLKFNNSLSAERLRELLTYHPEVGIFTWNVTRGSRRKGVQAGNTNTNGYLQIQIDKRVYVASRLAWLYMTGSFPPSEIDHKDRVPLNCAWNNLRKATHAQNCCNRKRASTNVSGYKGVCWHPTMKKWCAQVKSHGKVVWKEFFADASDAHRAYTVKSQEIHGEYARAA